MLMVERRKPLIEERKRNQGIIISLVGMGITLLVQAAALFIWGGKLQERVDVHSEQLIVVEARIKQVEAVNATMISEVSAMNERTIGHSKQLDRIEAILNGNRR